LTDIKLTVHIGGKIMQHFKALRTRTKFAISSILGLCFALFTFGCDADKNQVLDFFSNMEASAIGIIGSSDVPTSIFTANHLAPELFPIEISAETVPEGIRVTFANYSAIPQETKDIGICFRDWGGNEEPNWENADWFDDFYNLRETTCFKVTEQVKHTGMVIFPFVQPGHKYFITAFWFNNEDDCELTKTIECIADGGIYLNSNITLDLNNAKTGVTLSNAPSFTSDVQFERLRYFITVLPCNDGTEFFPSDSNNELFWDFEPKFKEYLKEIGVVNGDYPAFVSVNISIIHNNIPWVMELAKSPVFTYSF
jgi:hypothetical protein